MNYCTPDDLACHPASWPLWLLLFSCAISENVMAGDAAVEIGKHIGVCSSILDVIICTRVFTVTVVRVVGGDLNGRCDFNVEISCDHDAILSLWKVSQQQKLEFCFPFRGSS